MGRQLWEYDWTRPVERRGRDVAHKMEGSGTHKMLKKKKKKKVNERSD